MSIAGEGGRGGEAGEEGGREGGVCVGRGLSYSLPVTYYELIPTAPVKYYCKILTVICARERDAGTSSARARARLSSLTRRANELPRRAFAFFVRPSVSFLRIFISTPSSILWKEGVETLGGLLRARDQPRQIARIFVAPRIVGNLLERLEFRD